MRADDLQGDAVKRIKKFEAEDEAIRNKADAEVNARHDKLIADLENLKKEYTKAGDLDAALAIRERIRQLKEIPRRQAGTHRRRGQDIVATASAAPDWSAAKSAFA